MNAPEKHKLSLKAKMAWGAFFLLVFAVVVIRFQVTRRMQRPWAEQLEQSQTPAEPASSDTQPGE